MLFMKECIFTGRYVRDGIIRPYIIVVKYKKMVFGMIQRVIQYVNQMKSDKILEKVRRPGSHMVNLLNNQREVIIARTL